MQKDVFAATYSVMTKLVPRKRNRILFLKENGEEACILGEVREGEKGIDLC